MNVLCIAAQNHERSVVVLDHFRNFKGIWSILVTTVITVNSDYYIRWTTALSTISWQNQSSASLKLRRHVLTKTWKLALLQQLYQQNPSNATISESSQIRELHKTINFWLKKTLSVMLHSAKVRLCLEPCSLDIHNTLNRPSGAWDCFNFKLKLGLFLFYTVY